MKKCSKCGAEKPLDAYYKHSRGKYGVAAECKVCTNARNREYALAHPDVIKKSQSAYKLRHPDRVVASRKKQSQRPEVKEAQRIWRESHRAECREATKRWRLLNKHHISAHARLKSTGVSPEQYDTLYNRQEGRCAICSCFKPKLGKDCLNADHNHTTGIPRGLLCGHCNRALGLFKDSPIIMNNAIMYLRRYSDV